ncbi:MAG TPA: dihydrofolate reductase [Bacteroidota bacterium]|nr:dihydrofolate reductase [Bacteroidota bacterium]
MQIILIAALSQNKVIGNHGTLPWHVPEDLRRFRLRTLNHPVLMGRKTYESIGSPLPDRRTVVLSSHSIPDIETYPSLDEALNALHEEECVFVAGGAQVYKATLPLADELYLTHFKFIIDGDTFFPDFDTVLQNFSIAEREETAIAEYIHYIRKLKL